MHRRERKKLSYQRKIKKVNKEKQKNVVTKPETEKTNRKTADLKRTNSTLKTKKRIKYTLDSANVKRIGRRRGGTTRQRSELDKAV